MGMESSGAQAEETAAPIPQARRAPILAIATLLVLGVVTIAVVVAAVGRDPAHTRSASRSERTPYVSGPNASDHWHAALGVNDCGQWVPNWLWPPGATATGGTARAGSHGTQYAGLHSHGDGIIHIEPLAGDEMGAHATLGLYFRYGGWKLGANAVTFVGVHERNGNLCHGEPGVLRWAVNGVERHGDPSAHKIADGDVIELVFTTAGASLPPQSTVPSYRELRQILGPGPPV